MLLVVEEGGVAEGAEEGEEDDHSGSQTLNIDILNRRILLLQWLSKLYNLRIHLLIKSS